MRREDAARCEKTASWSGRVCARGCPSRALWCTPCLLKALQETEWERDEIIKHRDEDVQELTKRWQKERDEACTKRDELARALFSASEHYYDCSGCGGIFGLCYRGVQRLESVWKDVRAAKRAAEEESREEHRG